MKSQKRGAQREQSIRTANNVLANLEISHRPYNFRGRTIELAIMARAGPSAAKMTVNVNQPFVLGHEHGGQGLSLPSAISSKNRASFGLLDLSHADEARSSPTIFLGPWKMNSGIG